MRARVASWSARASGGRSWQQLLPRCAFCFVCTLVTALVALAMLGAANAPGA